MNNNILKLRAPFDRLRSYDITPEIALRKAIIMQAILDACNLGQDSKAKRIRIEAKAWLFGNSNEFLQTCLEADLDSKLVVRIAKEEIKMHSNSDKKVISTKSFKKPKKMFLDSDICDIVRKYI